MSDAPVLFDRITATMKEGLLVLKCSEPVRLFCGDDPLSLGIVDETNHIRLRTFQEHIDACDICGSFLLDVTGVVKLSSDQVAAWCSASLRSMGQDAVTKAARDGRLEDTPSLFQTLVTLKRYHYLPFDLEHLPYLFLVRLYDEAVSDRSLEELFDVCRGGTLRAWRDMWNVVFGRPTNHIFYLLKEAALSMLRNEETVQIVSERTGIEIRRVRAFQSYVKQHERR